ncbi:hypothetical protein GR925_01225 [Streptomyces sp. HUCO-GS316]|uniref:hypothetical protein n=1 Tax=Streptomyces sp. HUCO-GS316 TaxID=2692198 RepID=UPI001371F7A2|nr:hypothetical protein [Streptomyces sp. HUCO-GS316]MXM62105.1 hypothetical protein [Streptomyces sp. HUCO-GS316]
MHTLIRLAADALAALLLAVIGIIAWVIVQLGGGGAILASLLALPACALTAAAIHHTQRWTTRRRRCTPSPHSTARRGTP